MLCSSSRSDLCDGSLLPAASGCAECAEVVMISLGYPPVPGSGPFPLPFNPSPFGMAPGLDNLSLSAQGTQMARSRRWKFECWSLALFMGLATGLGTGSGAGMPGEYAMCPGFQAFNPFGFFGGQYQPRPSDNLFYNGGYGNWYGGAGGWELQGCRGHLQREPAVRLWQWRFPMGAVERQSPMGLRRLRTISPAGGIAASSGATTIPPGSKAPTTALKSSATATPSPSPVTTTPPT